MKNRVGYIASYVHSDNQTKNKAAGLLMLCCESDLGACVSDFQKLADRMCQLAVGDQSATPEALFENYPSLGETVNELSATLKEKIWVEELYTTKL